MIKIDESSIGRWYKLSNGIVVEILYKSVYNTSYNDYYMSKVIYESLNSRFKRGSLHMIRDTGKMKNYNVHIEELYLIPLKEKLDLL